MQNLVFPKPEVRWGCLMLNHNYLPTKASNDVPLELSSILLVEQGSELRDSRRLLLDSMGHPVLVVSAFADVCKLPRDSNCCLIALDLNPNEHEALRIAAHARLTWPGAKILLLGHPSEEFDDPLYDDSVSPSGNPSGIVETARRLLRLDRLGS